MATTAAEVRAVRLEPKDPPAHPEAIKAVHEAEFIVLGPGSWFTSVLPHLLVPELADAIVTTRAKRILNLNLTQAGETQGFTPAQHIELLAEHAPTLRLDYVVADTHFVGNDRHLQSYAASFGAELVIADLAMRDGTARHDPLRLASIMAEIMGGV